MQKTKIEWADYTWNPIKGLCPVGCSYCYARRMYKRFGWDQRIKLDEKELRTPQNTSKPSRIFVGSTIDLYHQNIPRTWIDLIIISSSHAPRHTYITLTKIPNALPLRFPQNWWVGMTITKPEDISSLKNLALETTHAGKRFMSFEPLLDDCSLIDFPQRLNWIIIGGLTPKPVHKKEWIDRLVERADEHNIPVFIKDNAGYPITRREFPKQP